MPRTLLQTGNARADTGNNALGRPKNDHLPPHGSTHTPIGQVKGHTALFTKKINHAISVTLNHLVQILYTLSHYSPMKSLISLNVGS